jgi:nitrous oxide reductase
MTDHQKAVLARRTVLGGAATAGAAAAAVALLPTAPKPAAPVGTAAAETPAPSGGYQLTDHVKQYYASARV